MFRTQYVQYVDFIGSQPSVARGNHMRYLQAAASAADPSCNRCLDERTFIFCVFVFEVIQFESLI